MTFDTFEEAFEYAAQSMGMTVDQYDQFIHDETVRANEESDALAKTAYQKRGISASKRTRIWCRDLHECQYCGARDKPLTIDHVIPESRGGTDDDSNLVTACKSCNSSKGTKTLEEWRGVS